MESSGLEPSGFAEKLKRHIDQLKALYRRYGIHSFRECYRESRVCIAYMEDMDYGVSAGS